MWAGHDWAYHSLSNVVTRIVAIDIQADDPDAMAARWAQATDNPVRQKVIQLDDAQIRFIEAKDGRGDGLSAADLYATDRRRAGEALTLGGFEFRLV